MSDVRDPAQVRMDDLRIERLEGLPLTRTRLALLAAIDERRVVWDERVGGWVETDDTGGRTVRTYAVQELAHHRWVEVSEDGQRPTLTDFGRHLLGQGREAGAVARRYGR